MKVAIITLIGENNYGNRLQNYALQEFLKAQGIEAETIYLKPSKSFFDTSYVYNKVKLIIRKISPFHSSARRKRFLDFNKNIKFYKKKYFYNEKLSEINDKYDYFVVGSDQVWNSFMSADMKTFMLNFVSPEKRIAFSASLGKSKITGEEKGFFLQYLKNIKAVSVREKDSQERLERLTNIPVSTIVDPTLLLSKNDWEKVAIRPKIMPNGKYIVVYLLGGIPKEYQDFIDEISSKYNMEVVDVLKDDYYKSGPAEFLYLISHSELVLTDSFHSIVFSILFEKPFIHLKRQGEFKEDMTIRMKNLERIFETKFRTKENVDVNDEKNLFSVQTQNKEKILENEKSLAIDFINGATKKRNEKNLNDVFFDCTGCGLCASVCPVGAISYVKNKQGFLRYNINKEKCIHCGKCKEVCIQHKIFEKLDFEKGIYLAKKDISIEDKSSSAGIFGELANHIICEGGSVYGAKYDKNGTKFARVVNSEDLKKIQGSKYLQADITSAYSKIENDLESGKKVLVCGTPCQVAGLKQKFFESQNLILTQFVCHGVPSGDVFDKWCVEKFGKKVDDVNFRHKEPSWSNYSLMVKVDEEEKIVLRNDNLYMTLFLEEMILADCCYDCRYAGVKTGADLIIGDAWGVEKVKKDFYSKNGVSIISPVTEKGKILFNEISSHFNIYEVPKDKYRFLSKNLFEPLEIENRKDLKYKFFGNLETENLNQSYINSKIIIKNSFFKRVLRKLKKIMKKILRK